MFTSSASELARHLPHHAPSVHLHCDLADAEFAGHLLVEQTANDQRHHVSLASGQGFVAVTQRAQVCFAGERRPAALDRSLDRAQQHLRTERLGQELDGARLHGLNASSGCRRVP